MKGLFAIAMLLTLTLTGTAFADQASHKKAVLKLLEVTDSRQIMDQMLVQMQTVVDKEFDAMELDADGREAAKKVKTEMAAWMSGMLSWENMKEMYVDIYMNVFSEEEINELVAFYQSPLGMKMLKKMPTLLKTTFEKTQAMVQQKIPEIQRRLEEVESDLQTKYKKKDQPEAQ